MAPIVFSNWSCKGSNGSQPSKSSSIIYAACLRCAYRLVHASPRPRAFRFSANAAWAFCILAILAFIFASLLLRPPRAIEVVKRFSEAWNRHDADAIVALFAEGGTYSNSDAAQGLTGQAIADFAKGVFAAFPDASFEIVSIGDTGGGLVAWQWLARATNTGPLADGNPPTGRSLTLPGASFTQVEGDKIRSEQVYHDRKTMDEQLGLKPK
jgi:steroid delta-isomerase-like uncharacterized protein